MANRSSHEAGYIEEGCSSIHATDIDKWADSLSKILEDEPQYMCIPGHPGRISRIPDILREIDLKAYEPSFLSLGPYHNGKPQFKSMEISKRMVLRCFLQAKPDLTLKDYLQEFKNIEPEARNFYSNIEMGSINFLSMLLLDSIYVLSVIFGMPNNKEKIYKKDEMCNINEDLTEIDKENMEMILRANEPDEQSLPPRIYSASFMHDFFLLENQLPLFVLEILYTFAYGGSKTQFLNTIKETIANMFEEYSKSDPKYAFSSAEDAHHLLHLCHIFFRHSFQQENNACQLIDSGEMFRLWSAVQLYEGGVSFATRSGSNLLDITFSSSGMMVMPCLFVDDNTNSLLRNLIALEQMKYPTLGLNISAYAVLLLHLVTTPKDAQLLRRKGIIQHHLASDKELVYLVNKLSIGLSFDYAEDNYSLKPVFQELKKYTEHRLPRWRAWLKHRYFNNPWMTVALAASSILLLLTMVHTYFTMYSYYVPCEGCH